MPLAKLNHIFLATLITSELVIDLKSEGIHQNIIVILSFTLSTAASHRSDIGPLNIQSSGGYVLCIFIVQSGFANLAMLDFLFRHKKKNISFAIGDSTDGEREQCRFITHEKKCGLETFLSSDLLHCTTFVLRLRTETGGMRRNTLPRKKNQ